MNYKVKYNRDVSVIDFQRVRNSTTFVKYNDEDMHKGLLGSLFVVCFYKNNVPVAVGRIIGDGVTSFIIKDVIVDTKYQKNGLGNLLMIELFKYIDKVAIDKAYIGLMSTKGKEEFYEKYGFIRRPNNNFGSGMIQYYKKK